MSVVLLFAKSKGRMDKSKMNREQVMNDGQEKDGASQESRPWRLDDAVKSSISSVLGLASMQAVLYGFAFAYNAVEANVSPSTASTSLPEFGPIYGIMAASLAGYYFLARNKAPSMERIGEAIKDAGMKIGSASVLGAATAATVAAASSHPVLWVPGVAGFLGMAGLAIRAVLINPLVERSKEVSTALDGMEMVLSPLGGDKLKNKLVNLKKDAGFGDDGCLKRKKSKPN